MFPQVVTGITSDDVKYHITTPKTSGGKILTIYKWERGRKEKRGEGKKETRVCVNDRKIIQKMLLVTLKTTQC